MKKFSVLTLAALIVVAFAIPATALESQFGGYFDARAFTQQNFTGEDETEDQDLTIVDTRTRIYYTAKINDNLKLVNKFEFDAVWGDTDPKSYGDIGADGVDVEVKNTYADFTVGSINAKVGTQPGYLARGFLFDDDFSGAIIAYNGEGFSIPFIWMKAYEGGMGKDANDYDADYYGLAPSFNLGEMFTINPYFLYVTSENASNWTTDDDNPNGKYDDLDVYYFGIDVDAKFDMASVWFTGIYQGGEADEVGLNNSVDFSAWMAAIGGNITLGPADVHGQFFYATGDDDNDSDIEVFSGPQGQSYYWAEIMGLGLFDGPREEGYGNYNSNNSCGDTISNIMAANIGASFSPMEKLTLGLDVWYAALAEDIREGEPGAGESELGTEVDLKITYELVEGLNLDVVGAYLLAGDATTVKDPNDADPYEIGTQLSLSF